MSQSGLNALVKSSVPYRLAAQDSSTSPIRPPYSLLREHGTITRRKAPYKLLLLLTGRKPNDCDLCEGRYGIEDTRQPVTETNLQGISPFCLAVDRQAASDLPAVFGAHHHALLSTPASMPSFLLDWMQRLVRA